MSLECGEPNALNPALDFQSRTGNDAGGGGFLDALATHQAGTPDLAHTAPQAGVPGANTSATSTSGDTLLAAGTPARQDAGHKTTADKHDDTGALVPVPIFFPLLAMRMPSPATASAPGTPPAVGSAQQPTASAGTNPGNPALFVQPAAGNAEHLPLFAPPATATAGNSTLFIQPAAGDSGNLPLLAPPVPATVEDLALATLAAPGTPAQDVPVPTADPASAVPAMPLATEAAPPSPATLPALPVLSELLPLIAPADTLPGRPPVSPVAASALPEWSTTATPPDHPAPTTRRLSGLDATPATSVAQPLPTGEHQPAATLHPAGGAPTEDTVSSPQPALTITTLEHDTAPRQENGDPSQQAQLSVTPPPARTAPDPVTAMTTGRAVEVHCTVTPADFHQELARVSAAVFSWSHPEQQHELIVHITPPALGDVRIRVTQQHDGGMVANIDTTTLQAHDVLHERLPELQQAFADAGLVVQHCSVSLNLRHDQGAPQPGPWTDPRNARSTAAQPPLTAESEPVSSTDLFRRRHQQRVDYLA